jgi:hypothetical protein
VSYCQQTELKKADKTSNHERSQTVEGKIQQLRKLYADAPQFAKTALAR